MSENAELVQSFRFAVWLTRSTSPGPTLSPPPSRTGPGSSTAGSAHAQRPAAGRTWRRSQRDGAAGRCRRAGRPAAGPGGDLLGQGLFAECQGLELEADVKELFEGGANDAVVRRAGRVKLVPLLLNVACSLSPGPSGCRRGPGRDAGSARAAAHPLWDWLQGMVAGRLPVPRYDGTVEIRDPADAPGSGALGVHAGPAPQGGPGPSSNAITGEIALETLTIAHEGLRMEAVS